jgi:hypothetical protein
MSEEHHGQPVAAARNTVCLHRVFAAKPEKVYRAFLNAEAMAKCTMLLREGRLRRSLGVRAHDPTLFPKLGRRMAGCRTAPRTSAFCSKRRFSTNRVARKGICKPMHGNNKIPKPASAALGRKETFKKPELNGKLPQ